MTEKKNILIVDDQESIIKALKRVLFSEPYDILSAPDGPAALELIRNRKDQDDIFLIISDQRMPHMTGTEFLKKTVELIPNALRFIISGYSDREDMIKALNQGVAHRYLTKPWNNDELVIMVNQASESPEKVRALVDSNNIISQFQELNIMDMEIKKFDEHRKNIFLGRIALHHGFINQEQLESSLTAMQSAKQAGRNVSLENILFEKGLISSENMGKIIAVTRRRMGKTFAKAAMKDFGVSQADIDRSLAIQSQEFNNTTTCRLLGDILVAENILTEEQKESIIIDQIYSEREDILLASGAGDNSNETVTKTLVSDGVVSGKAGSGKSGSGVVDSDALGSGGVGSDALGSGKVGSGKVVSGKDGSGVVDSDALDNINGLGIYGDDNVITLNKRKKNFFRQRALDKIFGKSAIKRNFATEPEILKALEEQLLHFTKTFQIKLLKDILVERSIILKSQAEIIACAIQANITDKPHPSTEQNIVNREKKIAIGQKNAFELILSADDTQASIRLVGEMPEKITPVELKELLATYHIIYGLVDDVAIELFLRNAMIKKESLAAKDNITAKDNTTAKNNIAAKDKVTTKDNFIIAKGKPFKLGRNALIKYYFENENARSFGSELASGNFDYRERGEIPNITQGTLLAEKIPLIPAINGITVLGIEIPAPIPLDVNLDCGQGVELSKDRLKAIAAVNGRPDLGINGKISVMPEKIIKGNVDFKTGNVKFSGDIIIHGTILAGFSVIGNNLTVNDIQEANVDIANTIVVKNSINSGNIKTGGTLSAQIINKSTIFARGDVIVQKEVIDCTIITSGKVIVPRGRILASKIYAAKGIEAMNIGSEVASPCELFPGADDYANEMLKIFSEKIKVQEENLVKLEAIEKHYENQSVKGLNSLSELSRLQEQLSVEMRKILKDKNSTTSPTVKKQMDESLSDIDKRVLKMDETISKLFDDNEILQNKIKEIKAKTKAVKTDIQYLLKEQNGFEIWYESQKEGILKNGVGVSVQGTVFGGTQITGTERAIIIKSTIKNSKIHQVINSDDPDNPLYEMRIDPLTPNRNQPHVYRT